MIYFQVHLLECSLLWWELLWLEHWWPPVAVWEWPIPLPGADRGVQPAVAGQLARQRDSGAGGVQPRHGRLRHHRQPRLGPGQGQVSTGFFWDLLSLCLPPSNTQFWNNDRRIFFAELIQRISRNYRGSGIENKKYIEITISNIIDNPANNSNVYLLVFHVK